MSRPIYGDVSRETSERLDQFESLVKKWSPKINLVSRSDLEVIKQRHIRDSLQLWRLVKSDGPWIDLGSGGGFPAVPISIVAKEKQPELQMICVESDQRKCAFLRTAARELDLNLSVLASRIEDLAPQNAKILTARALADLNTLFSYASLHLSGQGVAIFPKGARWEEEVQGARKHWNFELITHTSDTSENAKILQCEGISRV